MEACPARLRPATGAADGCAKQPDTTIIVLPSCVFIVCRFYILKSRCLFEKPPYSHEPRGRLTICTINCADRKVELIAVHHRIIDLARLAELWREREVWLLACVPIDAASTRKSSSHKAVNQLDFEVTKPCRVIVGDVGYCIGRNLISVAMSHFY